MIKILCVLLNISGENIDPLFTFAIIYPLKTMVSPQILEQIVTQLESPIDKEALLQILGDIFNHAQQETLDARVLIYSKERLAEPIKRARISSLIYDSDLGVITTKADKSGMVHRDAKTKLTASFGTKYAGKTIITLVSNAEPFYFTLDGVKLHDNLRIPSEVSQYRENFKANEYAKSARAELINRWLNGNIRRYGSTIIISGEVVFTTDNIGRWICELRDPNGKIYVQQFVSEKYSNTRLIASFMGNTVEYFDLEGKPIIRRFIANELAIGDYSLFGSLDFISLKEPSIDKKGIINFDIGKDTYCFGKQKLESARAAVLGQTDRYITKHGLLIKSEEGNCKFELLLADDTGDIHTVEIIPSKYIVPRLKKKIRSTLDELVRDFLDVDTVAKIYEVFPSGIADSALSYASKTLENANKFIGFSSNSSVKNAIIDSYKGAVYGSVYLLTRFAEELQRGKSNGKFKQQDLGYIKSSINILTNLEMLFCASQVLTEGLSYPKGEHYKVLRDTHGTGKKEGYYLIYSGFGDTIERGKIFIRRALEDNATDKQARFSFDYYNLGIMVQKAYDSITKHLEEPRKWLSPEEIKVLNRYKSTLNKVRKLKLSEEQIMKEFHTNRDLIKNINEGLRYFRNKIEGDNKEHIFGFGLPPNMSYVQAIVIKPNNLGIFGYDGGIRLDIKYNKPHININIGLPFADINMFSKWLNSTGRFNGSFDTDSFNNRYSLRYFPYQLGIESTLSFFAEANKYLHRLAQ